MQKSKTTARGERTTLRLPRDLADEIRSQLFALDASENRRHSQNAFLVALIRRGLEAEQKPVT